jgi:hypothetical protein
MEKLPLLVHAKAITDHGGENNVEVGHRLRLMHQMTAKGSSHLDRAYLEASIA